MDQIIRAPCLVESEPSADAGALRPALFLDRDGVINEDLGYVHRPDETRWIPGVFTVARDAIARGYCLIVVTNQAGIARGLYSLDQFERFTRWLHAEFAAEGCALSATYFCPHHADATLPEFKKVCECRKPAPGMIHAAIREFHIDARNSILIGNQPTDIEAARLAGIGCPLLLSDGDTNEMESIVSADSIEDLWKAACIGNAHE